MLHGLWTYGLLQRPTHMGWMVLCKGSRELVWGSFTTLCLALKGQLYQTKAASLYCNRLHWTGTVRNAVAYTAYSR